MLQSFGTHPSQFQPSAVNFKIIISKKKRRKTIFHFVIFQMKLFPFSVVPSGFGFGRRIGIRQKQTHTHVNRERERCSGKPTLQWAYRLRSTLESLLSFLSSPATPHLHFTSPHTSQSDPFQLFSSLSASTSRANYALPALHMSSQPTSENWIWGNAIFDIFPSKANDTTMNCKWGYF